MTPAEPPAVALDAEGLMRLALAQARRGVGRVFPNPSVGAVVVRGDRVLGRGNTQPPGGPHAEVVALDAAAQRHGAKALRGATLVVTLEPCSFTGRTGPCTEAAIDAGIRRVIVGVEDPHERVQGRGVAQLRAAGVTVETSVLEAECRAQHRGFFSLCERGRPFVLVKLASSLDGRIATASVRGATNGMSGVRERSVSYEYSDDPSNPEQLDVLRNLVGHGEYATFAYTTDGAIWVACTNSSTPVNVCLSALFLLALRLLWE